MAWHHGAHCTPTYMWGGWGWVREVFDWRWNPCQSDPIGRWVAAIACTGMV